MMAGAGDGMSPTASPMAEDKPMPAEHEGDMPSVFIPKEALGERQVKAGDTLELTVKAVDPDTGEVEASCEYEDKGGMDNEMASGKPGYEDAIDNMPEGES